MTEINRILGRRRCRMLLLRIAGVPVRDIARIMRVGVRAVHHQLAVSYRILPTAKFALPKGRSWVCTTDSIDSFPCAA